MVYIVTFLLCFNIRARWPEQKIAYKHVQHSHLIDHTTQLMPIIHSHCQYSLKKGEGHIVKYDHGALEKHIVDRFVHGKPFIKEEFPSVVFKHKIYEAATFAKTIRMKLPQV